MFFGTLILAIFLVPANVVLANKAGTSIEGPVETARGSEVTIRITSTHSANSAFHYTEWLKATANGKDLKRWDYTKENRPEGAVFSKEIKIKVTEDTEIVAESSCNIHGSKGPITHKIMVK